jgi:hypothetical protein
MRPESETVRVLATARGLALGSASASGSVSALGSVRVSVLGSAWALGWDLAKASASALAKLSGKGSEMGCWSRSTPVAA